MATACTLPDDPPGPISEADWRRWAAAERGAVPDAILLAGNLQEASLQPAAANPDDELVADLLGLAMAHAARHRPSLEHLVREWRGAYPGAPDDPHERLIRCRRLLRMPKAATLRELDAAREYVEGFVGGMLAAMTAGE